MALTGHRDHVVRAVIVRDGMLLLMQRAAWDLFGGLWELPGGGADGQAHPQALRRELAEEAALDVVDVGELLHVAAFDVPGGRSFDEHTYMVHAVGDVALSAEHDAFCWHPIAAEFAGPLTDTAARILRALTH